MNINPHMLGISHLLREGVSEDIDRLSYKTYIKFSDAAAERAGFEVDVLSDDVRLYAGGVSWEHQ
jgi:hypothetical protein